MSQIFSSILSLSTRFASLLFLAYLFFKIFHHTALSTLRIIITFFFQASLKMGFDLLDLVLAVVLVLAVHYVYKLLTSNEPSAVKKPAGMTGSQLSLNKQSQGGASSSSSSSSGLPKMTILYGSQSGTAENYAFDLSEEAKQNGFEARVFALEEYTIADLPLEQFVVFLVATFGEGDPTDNAREFWEFITTKANERDPSSVEGVTFAVFGLGNTQYRHFCAVGKRIDLELGNMGGDRLLPLGIGDDDGTLADDFDNWRNQFWAATRLKFNFGAEDESKAATKFDPMYTVNFVASTDAAASRYEGGLKGVSRFFYDGTKDHRTAVLNVVEAHELRKYTADGGSTAHLELSLEHDNKLTYRTADNLGIHPANNTDLVDRLAKRLGVSLTSIFTISTRGNRKLTMPATVSVGDALTYYLDINSLPRPKFAAILSSYAQDEKEAAQLLRYGTDDKAKDEFTEAKYNWVELLEAFPSINVSFAHYIEMVPRLQHRFYTISSSSKVHPRRLAVTVSRFIKDKPNGRKHVGVCSDQLCNLVGNIGSSNSSSSSLAVEEEAKMSSSQQLVAFVRSSSFRLPVRAGTHIIMIGPGTGIAPFRGFIQEFRTRTGDYAYGTTVLYFGCRHPDQDYLYREELEKAKSDGVLSQLNVAFSRSGPNKVYVQHLLAQNGSETWKLLNEGAYVYVCGGTGMGRDIMNTFVDICHKYGGMTKPAAETYIDRQVRNGKYIQELWSS